MRPSDGFFLLTLALIPIQLGKFFFHPESFVLGIPIDYLAISLYLVDFALFFYIATFSLENLLAGRQALKNLVKDYETQKSFLLIWLILTLYLLADTIFFARITALSYIFFIRFLTASLFGIYAAKTLKNRNLARISIFVLLFSAIWQSLVALGQFALQKSLGLWILGERSFDSSTVNIAHGQLFGRQFLRPYGTFPHPNVLAAFLLISFIIIDSHKLLLKKKAARIITLILLPLSLIVTSSKSGIFLLFLYLVTLFKKLPQILGVAALAALVLFIIRFLPEAQIASLSERLVLISAAIDIFAKNPLFGVGSLNFIPQLALQNLTSANQIRLLQPVHNVFLLILAENGFFGLIIFAFLLLFVLKKAKTKAKILLFISLVIFASFDHFLWTLNQGRLLFWLACAYIISSPKKN